MNSTVDNKVPRSRWIRIMPVIMLVYIVAAMDRNNIGFAISGGMDEKLGLTATFAGLASGIFFIGYLVLQVPGGLLAERHSAKKYIAWSVAAFGIMTLLSGLVQNSWQLLLVRFLLGVAEGGLFPAMLIIITRWFPNEERGKANSIFMMNAVIANIIGGPLAGTILSVWGWRELFFVEGLISLFMLLFIVPFIEDRPEKAKWLSKKEKEYIIKKLQEEKIPTEKNNVNVPPLKQMIMIGNMWKLVTIYLCIQVGFNGFLIWLPTVLKELTNSGIEMVGLLSTLPSIAAIIGLSVFGVLSDKSKNRKLYVALPIFGFAICLLLSNLLHAHFWLSFAFLIASGFFWFSPLGVFWAIPPLLFGSEVAAAGRGFINGMGNLGGFIGPFLVGWLITMFNYQVGFYFLVGFLLLGFLMTLSLPKEISGKSNSVIANGQKLDTRDHTELDSTSLN